MFGTAAEASLSEDGVLIGCNFSNGESCGMTTTCSIFVMHRQQQGHDETSL